MRTLDVLPKPNLVKIAKGGIPSLGKFIPKITNFSNLCGVSPHFKSENSEIWRECTDPGHPPLPLILFKKKSLRGICPLGNFYQKFKIFEIFSYLSPYFYTDNVKNSLKRTDRLRNLSKKTNFRQNRSRGLPVLHCLREVMHINF